MNDLWSIPDADVDRDVSREFKFKLNGNGSDLWKKGIYFSPSVCLKVLVGRSVFKQLNRVTKNPKECLGNYRL